MSQKKIPFRDIQKDGITYSFLDEWLLDREQARLSYVEGWASKGFSVALTFGIAFHDCLEWIAQGRSPKTIRWKILNPYFEKRSQSLEKEDRETLAKTLSLVEVAFKEYAKYWEGYDQSFSYLFHEKSFQVDHWTDAGFAIPLRGRWDAAYFDKDNRLWLMENKTKGQIDEEAIMTALPQDLQTMLYVHALQQHTGREVAGVLYNVIRRPLLRQKKNESVDEFTWRVQDDILTRPDYYFMRWKVELLQEDIVNWVDRTLNPILNQVGLWWDSIKDDPFDPWGSPQHFQNPSALFTKYGKSRYFNLLTRGSTEGLYKRTDS
tara:strand:+ start:1796 stop:2755 length:960 start_codon:yes stop_codon:yes gene_type:complete